MATVTPILDKRYKAKDGYPIKIRIITGDSQKNISTGYRVSEKQWNGDQVVKHPDAAIINGVIWAKMDAAKKYIADCQIKGKRINLDLIAEGKTSFSFCQYLKDRAAQYAQRGQIVMDRKLRRFSKELQECFGHDVLFDELNKDALRKLDVWLMQPPRSNAQNTRHKKFKFLRQFFQQAIDEDKTDGKNPFKTYEIGLTPVKKEKLTPAQIKCLEETPINPGPVNDARNLFLFSFYTKGTRFENCITLRRKQIQDGRIMIHQNKGQKHISIKIHSRLQAILDQYPKGKIVFPFLSEIPEDPKSYLQAIDSTNVIVNRNLKVVAGLCEIPLNLTFHMARHSFAYQLKQVTDNVNVIQDSLGHSDQRTTQIYLKSLGDEILDKEMEKLYGK